MTPSPGEVIDRMTILELKIKHSERKEFRDEKESLHKYLADKQEWIIPNELHKELATINTRLWVLEDRQRDLLPRVELDAEEESNEFHQFARNAITVVNLNNARAETVRKINVACGIDSVEKLHDTH
jgi:hypothetical protein